MTEIADSLKQLINNDQQIQPQDKIQSNSLKLPKINQQENVSKKMQKNSGSQYSLYQSNLPSIYKYSRENYSRNRMVKPLQQDLPQKLQPQSIIKHDSQIKQSHEINQGSLQNKPERQKKVIYDSEIDIKNLDSKQNHFNENFLENSNPLNESQKEDFFNGQQKRTTQISNNDNDKQIKKTEQMEQNESDMGDFQQRIIENRQFIKKQVKKKRIQIQKSNNSKVNKKNLKPKNRNESLYEKRIKEYKEMNENKYLKEKKKEFILKEQKQKEQKEQKQQREREKQKQKRKQHSQIINFQKYFNEYEKDESTQRGIQRKGPLKNFQSKELLSRYSPTFNLRNPNSKKTNIVNKQQQANQKNKVAKLNSSINAIINVNENLFEDLHNILENPHKSRSQLGYYTKMKTIKNIRQDIMTLEKKYKQLEQKQGQRSVNTNNIAQQLSLMKLQIKKPFDINLIDWNRFGVSRNKQFEFSQSNFTNEIQKINHYLNKNQQSIESYIENKRHLIELQINSKMKEASKENKLTQKNKSEELNY